MSTRKMLLLAGLAAMVLASEAQAADVFNLGGVRDPATGHWTGAASLETVHVGDAGNSGNPNGPYGEGSVSYEYNIGKYEVTAGQYCVFLNAVAKTDTYDLYNTSMWSGTRGCKIQRSGSSGSYTYSVASDYTNRPVNYVSWGDAARFANWLHNGQPTGTQSLTTTEDGAYYLNSASGDGGLIAASRKVNWKWSVTSENEWYKAAYYKGGSTSAGYWLYPTSSDSISTSMANYDGAAGHPTDVGSYAYPSPYGTFDQAGNVWEWNDAIVFGSCRGLRGSTYCYESTLMKSSCSGYDYYPTDQWDTAGFRVSQVPEPATLSLLALGGLTMLRRRSGQALRRCSVQVLGRRR